MKVKALQQFFKAHLHIVWGEYSGLIFKTIMKRMSALENFAKSYQFKEYTLAVYNHINEEAGILHYTESVKGNLIAMGTNGRRGLSHLMSGSKAEDIVNHGKSLIWTYRLPKEK